MPAALLYALAVPKSKEPMYRQAKYQQPQDITAGRGPAFLSHVWYMFHSSVPAALRAGSSNSRSAPEKAVAGLLNLPCQNSATIVMSFALNP